MVNFLWDGEAFFSIHLSSLFLGMLLLELCRMFAGWRRRQPEQCPQLIIEGDLHIDPTPVEE